MSLGTFDEVYHRYHAIVKRDHQQIYGHGKYEEFEWQPYKLLEAYSLAWQAEQNSELLFTSHWTRMQGATSTAIAMMIENNDACILVSDTRQAKDMTSRIFRTFQKQSGHIHSHVQPNVIHKRIWWMTGLRQCVTGNQPKLVIVDSETAYRKDRDQAVDDLRRFLGCGVVVLDAAKPSWFI